MIIPKGIEHNLFAPKEISIMLFEPYLTFNTENIKNNFTVANLIKFKQKLFNY